MNTLQKTLVAIAAGSLLSVSAQAAVYGNAGVGQPYVGAKVGKMDIDLEQGDADDPIAYGVYGGYNFDPNFGVELEYMGTSDADFRYNGVKGDINSKTFGAYGTYRYHLPNMNGLYAKGKLGIAKTTAEGKATVGGITVKSSADDTGVAGAVGMGYSATPNLSVEGEYAIVEKDSRAITIGAHVKF